MGRSPNTIELESLTIRYPPGVGQYLATRPAIERILGDLGLPTTGPPMAPARFPALAEDSLWQDDVPELQQALL